MKNLHCIFSKRILAVSLLAGLCTLSSLSYAQIASSTSAMNAADGSVTMIVRKGHNVREIAKRYSRMHNVPFKKTLEGLIAANSSSFANGNPDVLIIGAPFVLPNRDVVLGLEGQTNNTQTEKNTVAQPVVDNSSKVVESNNAPAVSTVAAPPQVEKTPDTNSITVPPIVTPVVPVAAAPVVAATPEKVVNLDNKFVMPIWAMCLLAIAVLMLLVKLFRRPEVVDKTSKVNEIDTSTSTLMPPTVRLNLKHSDDNESSDRVQVSSVEALVDYDEYKPMVGQTSLSTVSFGHVNLAKYGIPTAVLPLPEPQEQPFVTAPMIEPSVIVKPENDSGGLDLDVSGFMRRYAHQVPALPKHPALDFEELVDRTHLQAWLNQQTPEDVLIYAQDAHEERYDEIADVMLSDVLFRGDAEQCAMAVRLRKAWSGHRYS